MCVSVFLLGFILNGILCTFWTCFLSHVGVVFARKFSTLPLPLFSESLSLSLFLLRTPIMWMLVYLILSKRSLGFSGGSTGKEPACNSRDLGSILGLGRSPGEGKGYPLKYSGLENSMDCIICQVAKSQTWLRDFSFFFPRGLWYCPHFFFHSFFFCDRDFHHSVFQLTYLLFCLSYSPINFFHCIFHFSYCIVHLL